MKLLRVVVILFSLVAALLYQSCKDNNTVQPPVNPNTQNPNSPVLVSPVNDTITQNAAPLFDWQDFGTGATYRIQVSLDQNFAGTMLADSTGISVSQFQVPQGALTTGIYYYWHVIANTSGTLSNWSATWRFRVILAPPAAPNLVSPPNQSNNQPFLPLFDWDTVATAQFFRLQVCAQPNFIALLLDSLHLLVSQMQCPQFVLNTNTTYYWRVNAANSNGVSVGPWSQIFSFTTAPGPQPNSLNGHVTFVDTNVVYPVQPFYIIAAYNNWPPINFSPFAADTLQMQKIGGVYQSDYHIRFLPDDNYILAVYYNTGSFLFTVPVLGIYGCDTVHQQYSNCPQQPVHLTISNGTGLDNLNILSWADTTRRIY